MATAERSVSYAVIYGDGLPAKSTEQLLKRPETRGFHFRNFRDVARCNAGNSIFRKLLLNSAECLLRAVALVEKCS